jgi:hypothetical protein
MTARPTPETRPRPTNPRLTGRISVRVTGKVAQDAEDLAKSLGIYKSELVEMLLFTNYNLKSPLKDLKAGLAEWRKEA